MPPGLRHVPAPRASLRGSMHPVLTPRLRMLSAAHFTIDAYSSFFLPLLPLLVARLGLNYTMVGGLVAIGSVSSSFSQPLFGLWADRLHRPWFVLLGPLVAAVFMSAIGLAGSYPALVALLLLGGLGVAAFHPQTASIAGSSSRDRGVAMSFWITGGTLGWALGPMFATTTVRLVGLEHTYVAVLPGLLMTAIMFPWFLRESAAPRRERTRTRPADLRPIARPLGLLYGAVATRSAVSAGFATFLPLWASERGWSVVAGGTLTTVYLTLGALGGLAGGALASRIGGRRVVRHSFLVAMPCFALFFLLPQPWSVISLLAGYFALQTSLPVNVVLGQELSPAHAGTISSLLMGAAWGVGALCIGPVGAFADHAGLERGLMLLSLLLLVGYLCASAFSTEVERRSPAE